MDTVNRITRILYLTLILMSVSACGTFQVGLEDEALPGSDVEAPPVGVLVARDTILRYLQAQYGSEAPSSDLTWLEMNETPDGVVGASSFRFEAGRWTMTIAFPVVAPDAMIYTVELYNSTTGFHWMGQVDGEGSISDLSKSPTDVSAAAWAGRFAALEEGAGVDDYFILLPEGVGAVGVEGADQELEQMIKLLAANETEDIHHIWGTLTCGVADFNGCRILVDRIRSFIEITDGETVDGWEGVIYSGPPEPRSGGDDYFALLGDFPVQFGIWAMDEGLRSELETLRDTQTVIRVWGTLVAGIPDWNLTQIDVERYELVEVPSASIPPALTWDAPDSSWMSYTNQRQGYQFQYPATAEIQESGPMSYQAGPDGLPIGGLPDGVELENYIDYLEETLGHNLCVTVTYSLGYIQISAAENEEFKYAICGRTGVGAAEIIPKEEELVIAGMTVTASGIEVRGEGDSLNAHNETLVVNMPDGTRIEYGALPRMDATYQDYLMKTRDMLLQILATFEYVE